MFAAIAPRYDLNNRLHSFGLDQRWRRAAVRAAELRPGDEVLDAACGTGDLTRAFARAGAQRAVGLDFCPEMLAIARRRRSGLGDSIEYVEGDAQDLPFDDDSVDVVSIAFGIRNVQSSPQALAEFRRVLRPGGRLVILEFDRPRSRVIAALHNFYCSRVMPITATLIGGPPAARSGAYRYLPRSVDTFLDRAAMAAAMREAGFTAITQRSLTFGVAMVHRGVAP